MQFPRKIGGILAVTILLVSTVLWLIWPPAPGAWTESEIELLRSLWIGSLPPVPADPSNAVADDPRAARFGQRLFFDTRLSANGEVACATCHQPEHLFTDGLDVAQGVARGERHTMGLAGVAYSPWMFWDGRRDSLWSQALAPLESPVEHGGNRLQFVELLVSDAQYRSEYAALFDELPELPAQDPAITEVFVNMGKAIAAYERLLVPGASRFDRYVQALLGDDER